MTRPVPPNTGEVGHDGDLPGVLRETETEVNNRELGTKDLGSGTVLLFLFGVPP